MINTQANFSGEQRQKMTVWGYTPDQLHDLYWACHDVQVVRRGSSREISNTTGYYLLVSDRALLLFDWFKIKLRTKLLTGERCISLRVVDKRKTSYREKFTADSQDNFKYLRRIYSGSMNSYCSIHITTSKSLARMWSTHENSQLGGKLIDRKSFKKTIPGLIYSRSDDNQLGDFTRELSLWWPRPNASIPDLVSPKNNVWAPTSVSLPSSSQLYGPIWIGAEREVPTNSAIVGPEILWDNFDAPISGIPIDIVTGRNTVVRREQKKYRLQWVLAERRSAKKYVTRQQSIYESVVKRIFDIAIAVFLILLTLCLYPLIMLLIYFEDGRPLFFAHRREGKDGMEFPFIKFRTMYNNADQIKTKLLEENQADGPQFFIQDDPRITRTGKLLRKFGIDEIPALFNVLVGQMSIVGPRPSPYKENQYSPAWREARLSVKPGITGLWQIKRSREPGKDFQEWIRYDIKYVENVSFRMDLYIIYKTIIMYFE